MKEEDLSEQESVERIIERLKFKIKRAHHRDHFIAAEQYEYELSIEEQRLIQLQNENRKED